MNKQEILNKLKPKNIEFKVDMFEELILQDIAKFDNETQIKLNRNLTDTFNKWIKNKLKAKEQVKIAIKGSTRCIFGNEKILTNDLKYKPIKDFKIKDKVLSYNHNTKSYEEKEVLELFNNGKKQVYEVKLLGGEKVITTLNHPFYCYDKKTNTCSYQKLKDIKVGSYIARIDNLNIDEKKTKYDLNEIKLIGFYFGDGYSRNNNSKNGRVVVFDLSKKDKLNYFYNLIDNTKLNYKVSRYEYIHKENPTWANGNKLTFSKKYNKKDKIKDDFTQIIYDLKLIGKLCDEKFIPEIFLKSTKKEIWALLSGLFSSDSCIDKTKGLIYCTTSKQLFEDIQILLNRVSLNYRIFENKPKIKNHKTRYNINITMVNDLKQLLIHTDLRQEFKEKILNVIDIKDHKYLHNNFINRDNLKFKRIKSIKYIGVEETYDLTIKDNHNYICNNVILHNSGKSLVGLKIISITTNFYEYLKFDTEKQVCANQKELKQKLEDCEFGESFLIDENAFANTGMGSMTELQQLKDINNIIAKQNNHMVYITPETFLNVGAILGLAYWGKDTKNWLSRFLLYSLKGNSPTLLGYVVFDVGKLFQDTGCLIYSQTGGCTNPNRLLESEIDKDYIKNSDCIPEKYKKEDLVDDKKQCPFYKICQSQMCQYEKKKDKWIEREMKGGLGERETERIELALKLFERLSTFDTEKASFRFRAKNGKELKLKVNMKLPFITNSKLTGTEKDEIMTHMLSLLDLEMLKDTCKLVNKDYQEIIKNIQNGIHENQED